MDHKRNSQMVYVTEKVNHNWHDDDGLWLSCEPVIGDLVSSPNYDGYVEVRVPDSVYGSGVSQFRVRAIHPMGNVAKELLR